MDRSFTMKPINDYRKPTLDSITALQLGYRGLYTAYREGLGPPISVYRSTMLLSCT